jgi:hypothetical protein
MTNGNTESDPRTNGTITHWEREKFAAEQQMEAEKVAVERKKAMWTAASILQLRRGSLLSYFPAKCLPVGAVRNSSQRTFTQRAMILRAKWHDSSLSILNNVRKLLRYMELFSKRKRRAPS